MIVWVELVKLYLIRRFKCLIVCKQLQTRENFVICKSKP